MTPELIHMISRMIVSGNRLELPEAALDNYPALKKCLIKAGGKYSKNGFTFKEEAGPIRDLLLAGEALDDVKKFQYYPTPPDLAQYMVTLAGIESKHRTLEPSAGTGALADFMFSPDVCELMPDNRRILALNGYNVVCGNFLDMPVSDGPYDRIVANPPFINTQYIDHIRHMYELLGEGGRIVSVTPMFNFQTSTKHRDFRDWLNGLGAGIEYLGDGRFKASGTMTSTCLVTIDKPEQAA